jgi:hypothetical protein
MLHFCFRLCCLHNTWFIFIIPHLITDVYCTVSSVQVLWLVLLFIIHNTASSECQTCQTKLHAFSIGVVTSISIVTNHGEGISPCLPTISNFPAIHDAEISFLWNMHTLDADWKNKLKFMLYVRNTLMFSFQIITESFFTQQVLYNWELHASVHMYKVCYIYFEKFRLLKMWLHQ